MCSDDIGSNPSHYPLPYTNDQYKVPKEYSTFIKPSDMGCFDGNNGNPWLNTGAGWHISAKKFVYYFSKSIKRALISQKANNVLHNKIKKYSSE